jgi:hypothetical protein
VAELGGARDCRRAADGRTADAQCGDYLLVSSPVRCEERRSRYALDYHFRRHRPAAEWLGFFRRILQLHLCIIYFFGGLTKALGSGWWNGENLWTALTRPPFDVLPAEVIARFSSALPALGISVWLLELTYPLFIWPQKTRLACLTLICLMHFGIGVGMGMHLFAIVMIVLNVAAFGAPSGGSLPMGSVAPDARQ